MESKELQVHWVQPQSPPRQPNGNKELFVMNKDWIGLNRKSRNTIWKYIYT